MRIATFFLNVYFWYVHVVTLFNCYNLFHCNNINETASPKFIMLNSTFNDR